MVKISVIIPVYNDEKRLHKSIGSVLSQTFKDIEIICVDDGSTDNSLDVLNEFSQQYDFIRVFSQKNQGAAIARNYALSKANGEYIAFLDADDFYIDDESLEKLYDVAFKNNANIVSGNIKLVNSDDEFKPFVRLEYFNEYKTILPQEYGLPWSFYKNIIKKEFFIKNNITFPDLLRGEDPVFFAEVLSKLDKIYCVPVDFYAYYYIDGGAKCDTYRKIHDTVEHYKRVAEILSDEKFHDVVKEFRSLMLLFIDMIKKDNAEDLLKSIREVFSDDEENLRLNEEYFFFKYKNDENLSGLVEFKKNDCRPRISVIIPYAGEDINYSFDNLLNQTFDDFDIIFLSNKNQLNIDLKNKHYSVFEYENFNFKVLSDLLDKIDGEYVYFYDFNEISQNTFEELYKNILFNKSDVALCKSYKKDINSVFKNSNFRFFTFDYRDVPFHILNHSLKAFIGLYDKSFLKKSLDTNLCSDESIIYLDILLKAENISFVPKSLISSNCDFDSFSNLTSTLDSIENYLVRKNCWDEFEKHFDCFKFHQFLEFYSQDANEYENWNDAKSIDINLNANKCPKNLFKKYDYFILSDNYHEFKTRLELDKLKKEYKKLSKQNRKLKKDIKKLKKENNELNNSKGWKNAKPLRKLRDFFK